MYDYLFLGAGPKSFKIMAPLYGSPATRDSHNALSNLGAEIGVIAVLIFLLIYIISFINLARIKSVSLEKHEQYMKIFMLGIFLIIGAFTNSRAQ